MDGVNRDPIERHNLPASALVLGFLALLSSTFGMGSSWPPRFLSEWLVTWTLSGAAICVGLAGARQATRKGQSLLAALAILVALFAGGVPLHFYRETYHDYPMPALMAFAILLPVACGLCRLKPIAVAWIGAFALAFYSALLPAQGSGRWVRSSGDLTVALEEPQDDSRSWTLEIQGPPGKDLSARYDLENVRAEGRIGAAIPVTCWPPNPFDGLPQSPSCAQLNFDAFVPAWTRSWNAEISVPVWPATSEAHVVVEVGKKAVSPARATTNGFTLEASDAAWTTTSHRLPSEPCLGLLVASSSDSESGYMSDGIRLTDETGRTIPYDCVGGVGDQIELEAFPKHRRLKRVRIDLYSHADRERSRVSFAFPRLPNPR